MEKEKPLVSVLICVKNAEKYISDCIQSILQQTFSNFELVIIDDLSNDQTPNIIAKFMDSRIKYFKNSQWLGISKSRNACLKHANGDYVFFTDGDCIVSKDWLAEGIKFLIDNSCAGVEGKTFYVSKNYQPTFSDHFCESFPGDFMTGNIAYKTEIARKVGGFDEKYSCHEDRDFGLRFLKYGRIKFNPNMKVIVQKHTLSPKELVNRANAIRNRVYLFKKFNERKCMAWRFVDPISLAIVLFPPLVFISLLSYRFKTKDDYRLVPFKYINLVYARLQLWQESAKQHVFLV